MAKGFKIFLITLLVLITLLGSLFIYIYQNIDQLKMYALKEVNSQLLAELKAKDIDVTFIQTFPKVSLSINEVSLADPINPGKYLLKASHLYLGFDFYDVLREQYNIHLISLDSGFVNLYTDAAGRQNFDILKTDKNESKKKKPFSFDLNKLELSKIQLKVIDHSANYSVNNFVEKASFSGKFSDAKFTMEIALDAYLNEIKSGSIALLKDKKISIDCGIDIDNQQNKIQVLNGEFGINQLLLSLSGSVQTGKKESNYQLSFKANKLNVQDLLSSLPIALPESMKSYQSNGKVFFKGSLSGMQNNSRNPRLTIDFGIEQGSLIEPDTKMKLDQINLTGNFDTGKNGKMEESVISIPNFQANLIGSSIKGSLHVSNLLHPVLGVDLTGTADLQALNSFFKFEDVSELIGNVQFTLTLKGQKNDHNWDWSSPMNKGILNLNLEKVKLNYLTKSLDQAQIHAEINNQTLTLNPSSLHIGESDISISGVIPDFMNFLVQKNALFKGNMKIQSNKLNVNDLLIYDSSDPLEEGEEPMKYDIGLAVKANTFIYDDFYAINFSSAISLVPGLVEFRQTQFKTCSGTFDGQGDLITKGTQTILKSSNEVKNININELFKQFNNFGQQEFTSKNLFGTLYAKTELMLVWDEKMNLIQDKILVITDMSVKNGELINYEPLNSLSKFVDVNELKNLKFAELKNTITIKDKVLNIPGMEIRNNALNLILTGEHTFENILDYKIKLSLSELLSKKRKPQTNEFEEEDTKTKGINLYLTIKGPISDLKFVFDRKSAKAQLKQDVKQEKEAIKEIFKQEFGIKKDSSLKKLEKKNENNDELEFEDN